MHTLSGCPAIVVFALLLGVLCGCLQPSTTEGEGPGVLTTLPHESLVQAGGENVLTVVTKQETHENGTLPFLPGGIYRVGDRIIVGDTTILSPGNHVLIEVVPVSFGPSKKSDKVMAYGTSGVVAVGAGEEDSLNTWSFVFNTWGWEPDDYILKMQGIEVPGYTRSSRFTLQPGNSTP